MATKSNDPLSSGTRRLSAQLAAGLLVLAAFGLYVYRLDGQSLWFDEIVQYHFVFDLDSLPPDLVWIKKHTRHWLYRYGLRLWVRLVPNVFGLRWPSVMAGTIVVALIYRLGTSLSGRRAGLLAALFLLFLPPQVYFAQEARQYELVVLGSLLSLWAMLLLERGSPRWASWAYGFSVVGTAALHVLAAFWLATQSVWVAFRSKLWTGRIRLVWPLTGMGMLAAVAALAATDTGPRLHWLREPALRQLVGLHLDFPSPLSEWLKLSLAIAVLGLMGVGMWRLWQQPSTRTRPYSGRAATIMLSMLTFGPPLAAFIISYLWTPIWFWRYFMPSKASFILLLALATASLRRRWVAAVLAGIVLTTSMVGSTQLIADPDYQRDNWRDVAAYVAANQQPGDSALVPEDWLTVALRFYLPDERIEVGSLNGLEAEGEIALRTSLEKSSRVWVVVLERRREDFAAWRGQVAPEAVQLDFADFGTLDLYLLASSAS